MNFTNHPQRGSVCFLLERREICQKCRTNRPKTSEKSLPKDKTFVKIHTKVPTWIQI